MQRRIFGPKREEATGGWKKLHNEELHNLYLSPSIIGMIKSRRMRFAGMFHARGEKLSLYSFGRKAGRKMGTTNT
jgi:hypothetical protein